MPRDPSFDVQLRFCNGVALLSQESAEKDLKWIHLATVGEYLGHWQGPFKLTGEFLEQIVQNFRADERYVEGPNKMGIAPVVPFDYEHASEQSPTLGDIPSNGTPAPAWAVELEVRPHVDGAQLWALSKLGDKIRGQIEAGEYRFVSMAFTSEGVDQRSGKKIGHLITSIAFTNQPFLTGIEPIAAKARASGQAVVIRFDENGRSILALATTGQDGLQHTGSTEAPVGNRAPDIGDHMGTELSSLGKKLAALLTAANLNKGRLLQVDEDVGEAVAEAISSNADLASLLDGLGVTNAEQALANITELKDAKAKLDSLSAELSAALSELDQARTGDAEMEVEAAIAAKGFDPSVQPALLSHFKVLTKEHGHADGRVKFRDHYGVKARNPDRSKDHLLQLHAAGPGGTQLKPTLQATSRDTDTDGADVIDLAAYAGRNDTEKLLAHCRSKDPNFSKQPWGAQVNHAAQLRRNAKVINSAKGQ